MLFTSNIWAGMIFNHQNVWTNHGPTCYLQETYGLTWYLTNRMYEAMYEPTCENHLNCMSPCVLLLLKCIIYKDHPLADMDNINTADMTITCQSIWLLLWAHMIHCRWNVRESAPIWFTICEPTCSLTNKMYGLQLWAHLYSTWYVWAH